MLILSLTLSLDKSERKTGHYIRKVLVNISKHLHIYTAWDIEQLTYEPTSECFYDKYLGEGSELIVWMTSTN